jgi:hypothetical protein
VTHDLARVEYIHIDVHIDLVHQAIESIELREHSGRLEAQIIHGELFDQRFIEQLPPFAIVLGPADVPFGKNGCLASATRKRPAVSIYFWACARAGVNRRRERRIRTMFFEVSVGCSS